MEDRVNKLTDLKKLILENQKLSEETLTLASKNRTSLEINAELHLAKVQAGNQKLSEELLALAKRNSASLEMYSELYDKVMEAIEERVLFFEVNPSIPGGIALTNSKKVSESETGRTSVI